ncbi:hypothetical protein ACFFOE_003045 [Klebsiella aerogenes]
MRTAEKIELFVELVGVDPDSGANIRMARCASTRWYENVVADLINQALDEGMKFAGMDSVEGLLTYDVTLDVWLYSSGIWPGFALDADTLYRINACGAALGFDPYIYDVPPHACDLQTWDDFTVIFSALGVHQQRNIIAKRGLRERGSIEDIFIFQVFKDALKYHNDNSLRIFREKQSRLTLYVRYYENNTHILDGGNACEEGILRPGFFLDRNVFTRLNASRAILQYWPFEERRPSA